MKLFIKLALRFLVILFAVFIVNKIFKDINLLNFSSAFTLSNISLMLLASMSLICSVLVRSIRWRYLVYSEKNADEHIDKFSDFWNYLFSLVLNLFIPIRSGEMFRILSSGGPKKSLIKNSLSIFIEKFFDIFVIFGGLVIYLLVMGTDFSPIISSVIKKVAVILGLLSTLFALLLFLSKPSNVKIKKNYIIIEKIKNSFRANRNPKFLMIILALTILAWSLEVVKFVVVWYVLGNSLSISLPLLAFFLATLSMGLPGAPAAVGTFHYAIIVATIPFGIAYLDALNYAVLTHLLYFLALISFSFFIYMFTGLPNGLKETTLREVFNKIRSGKLQ
tara:strand:- start:7284 stop:8285 length:1002 start_codon:yes stop_codon:yes gene_type:complete